MQDSSDSETEIQPQEQQQQSLPSIKDTEQQRQQIRNQIANMSFEDLQNLKSKIGLKLFNEKILGNTKHKPQSDFKRANKNRPREMSSKRRVPAVWEVPSAKKAVVRDPRFDPLCGSFDKKTFRENYKFLDDVKRKELKVLKEEMKETRDESRKKEIKFVMQRLENQLREKEKKQKEELKEFEEKKEIKQKLMKGEKPEFKKKSEKTLENLVKKYEELKNNNKLDKHIIKRTKKLAQRDRKTLNK